MSIEEAIRETIIEFGALPRDINKGRCIDFAQALLGKLPPSKDTFPLFSESFYNDDTGKWNLAALHQFGEPSILINPMICDGCGAHEWIYHKGKHYDAECATGAESFTDLPYFKRLKLHI